MSGFVRRGAQARINEEIRQKGEISDQQVNDIVRDEGRKIASVAKIMTATAALAGGADVETAVTSADSALDNNWLQVGYYAVVGGLAVYTAYDIYDTYQTEGPEAALKKAGVEIAMAATGGFIVKKGASLVGKAYPTAEALWLAYVDTSPGMMAAGAKISQWADSASAAAGKVIDTVGKARIGQAATKLEEGAARVKGKILGQIDAKIKWGKGIQEQGMPWEDYLESQLSKGARLPKNFKTFDFFEDATKRAISAKTLNTQTASRLSKPEQIYSSLKKNIDSVALFDQYALSGVQLSARQILSKEVHLAIPKNTNMAQMAQIEKAVDYGKLNNVKVIVKETK